MKTVLLLFALSMIALASVNARSSSGEPGGASSSHVGSYSEAACTVLCRAQCTFGSGEWPGHDAEAQGGAGGGGHHPECMAGQNCATVHGCGAGNETFHPEASKDSVLRRQHVERLNVLLEAAATGSVGAAVELLSAYPDHAVYNDERRSVQLFGCSKDVLSGNIPLSEGQLVAVLAIQ